MVEVVELIFTLLENNSLTLLEAKLGIPKQCFGN